MITRWLLLVLGGLALTAGIMLSVLWWKMPAVQEKTRARVQYAAILVAARAIGPGTLLAPQDVRWQRMRSSRVPPGSLLRGQVSTKALWGAALRRRFIPGAPLSLAALLEPGAPGFLPAALAPGMRAVSLALGGAEGESGLLEPGDRVDVILTQDFAGPRIRPTERSVGEVVLRDLRVVAVGRRIAPRRAPARGASDFARKRGADVPQSVTLEVTSREAAALMVATRLGRLQLALLSSARRRPAHKLRRGNGAVWAAEVSPALRTLQETEPGEAALRAPARGFGTQNDEIMPVAIVRGSHFEWRCFDARVRTPASCPKRAPRTASAPPRPQPGGAPALRAARASAPTS